MVNAQKHRKLLDDTETRAIKMAKKHLTKKQKMVKKYNEINSICNPIKEQISYYTEDTSKTDELMKGIVNGTIKVKGEL